MLLKERLALALSRKEGGTQSDLARACGISTASVSNWFTGETKSLRGSSLLRAAAYLGVSTTWLDTGAGPMYEVKVPGLLSTQKDEWPFELVTPLEWDALSPLEKGRIEGLILGLASNKNHRSGTDG